MSTKTSKNFSSLSAPSASTEDSIITLVPCEYNRVNGYDSPSEDSIDSSEIVNSSDDELETIKINKFYKINKHTI